MTNKRYATLVFAFAHLLYLRIGLCIFRCLLGRLSWPTATAQTQLQGDPHDKYIRGYIEAQKIVLIMN